MIARSTVMRAALVGLGALILAASCSSGDPTSAADRHVLMGTISEIRPGYSVTLANLTLPTNRAGKSATLLLSRNPDLYVVLPNGVSVPATWSIVKAGSIVRATTTNVELRSDPPQYYAVTIAVTPTR